MKLSVPKDLFKKGDFLERATGETFRFKTMADELFDSPWSLNFDFWGFVRRLPSGLCPLVFLSSNVNPMEENK